jgi:hypothetical protein
MKLLVAILASTAVAALQSSTRVVLCPADYNCDGHCMHVKKKNVASWPDGFKYPQDGVYCHEKKNYDDCSDNDIFCRAPSPPTPPNGTCAATPACAANGLAGDCCPTKDGVYLKCCNAAECSAAPACAALGLSGNCCPTSDNIFLSCCSGSALSARSSSSSSSSSSSDVSAEVEVPDVSGSTRAVVCPANYNCNGHCMHVKHENVDTWPDGFKYPQDGVFCHEDKTNMDKCSKEDIYCMANPTPPPPSNTTQCSAYPACAGLDGDCCPTKDGVTLKCCAAAACSAAPNCAKLGLEGDCCPTSDGVWLECCSSQFLG